ncbi:MAG TPA: 4-hydroxy-tetrahydrodipicolinate reductase, partial [Clostridia bacterium]|nr:4-hydroxy-tetrahydrodipicolinate reductase [Clostridia bacterium]
MINVILHGCNGKMGQVVASIASTDPDVKIVAGIDRSPNTFDNPFPVYTSLEECPHSCNVIIDFSLPQALPSLLEGALAKKSAIVVATTGLSNKDQESIVSYSKEIPIFQAANMSIGVNLMYELIQKAARVLGDSFDIEIVEKHHNEKIDSPSGTAFALADSINEVFLNSKNYVYGRHSNNDRRSSLDIGIHAIRGGTIVGE